MATSIRESWPYRPEMVSSETFPPDKHRNRKKKPPVLPARTTSLGSAQFPVATEISLPEKPTSGNRSSRSKVARNEWDANSPAKPLVEPRASTKGKKFPSTVEVLHVSDHGGSKTAITGRVLADSMILHKVRSRPTVTREGNVRSTVLEDELLDKILNQRTERKDHSVTRRKTIRSDDSSDNGSTATNSSKSSGSQRSQLSAKEQGAPYSDLPPVPVEERDRLLLALLRKLSFAIRGNVPVPVVSPLEEQDPSSLPPPPPVPNPKSTLRGRTRPVSCHSPKKVVTFSDRTTFYAS